MEENLILIAVIAPAVAYCLYALVKKLRSFKKSKTSCGNDCGSCPFSKGECNKNDDF